MQSSSPLPPPFFQRLPSRHPGARRLVVLGAGAALVVATPGLPARLGAQPPADPGGSYVRQNFGTDDGLPDTQVNAIAQTPDGFLWLGTRRGVARFDGTTFRLFPARTTPGLPTGIVNALSVDRRGRLWIGTAKGLVVREGDRFRLIDSSQVPARTTWDVLHDREGRLWVVGDFGVRRGDGVRFTPVPGTEGKYVYSLAQDSAGRVWMAGREFLASMGASDERPVEVRLPGEERYFDVVAEERPGALWVGTRRGAVRLDVADPYHVREVARVAEGDRELGNEVWTLTRTPRGDLWLGSERMGIVRWDGRTLSSYATPPPNGPDPVWWLTTDMRGRVWAGTTAGLTRLQYSPFATVQEGLAPRSTWSVRPDRDGTQWAATSDGRVFYLDGLRWRPMVPRIGRNLSSTMAPRAAGGMYVVYDFHRVLVVERGGVWDISAQVGARQMPAILGVHEDRDGTLWFATDSGTWVSRAGVARPADASLALDRAMRPRAILRDPRGRLLIGRPFLTVVEGARATRYDSTRGLRDHDVLALYADSSNVWVGTADSGLYVLRGGRVTALGHLDERLGREVLGIVEDRLGYLWLTSSFGLSRVFKRDLERVADGDSLAVAVRGFDRADGLPTTEFNGDYQGQLHVDGSGRLWLPSYAGVVTVDPRDILLDSLPPQVHLDGVEVDGAAYPVDRPLQLTEHPSRLEVTVAATNALVPSRVRAQVRMRGIDSTWRDAGTRRTFSFGPLRGGRYRFEARVANENGGWNPAIAGLALEVALEPWEHAWFAPLLLLLAGGTVAAGVRWRLTRASQRALELTAQVEERTRELETARASLEVRVRERTAELAHELEERKRLEQRLVAAQKLEGIGRLAGGVAHEINNSITGVLGFTELARASVQENPQLRGDLDEIWKAGKRVADVARQLLAFARRQQTKPTTVQLTALLHGMERGLLQALGPEMHLAMTLDSDAPAVLADASQVEQLVVNLVTNARDAMPNGGTVHVHLASATVGAPRAVGDTTIPPGRYATLSVADTGTGMSREVRARLFEPFFTTKALNRGTGLGLAVCHGIVARHRGAIEVESSPGKGTTITIWLPEGAGGADEIAPDLSPPIGRETILLVEDEGSVREVATRMLSALGYAIVPATDGAAALALVDAGAAFDVVVTDVMMPALDGPSLARALRDRRIERPIVFISGYAGLDAAMLAELATMGPMVAKPFAQDALARAVRSELDRDRRTPAGHAGAASRNG